MKATINLFKALPVENKKKKTNKSLDEITLRSGFVFSKEVIANYTEAELKKIIVGLKPEQLNASFHKSWGKVKDESIQQLVAEQIIHYYTTYGFEAMGLKSCAYIPAEELDIPKLKEGIPIVVIKGLTKKELKERLIDLLCGIALSDDTIKDVIDVALFVEFDEHDIEEIKNKQVKIMMYDYLSKVPSNPVEFLRYVIFKATGETLIIKSEVLIDKIKEANQLSIVKLFNDYDLKKLSSIFYRYKPLFLAFRTNKKLKVIINKVRRLAVKNHKPVGKSYLDSITEKIKKGEKIIAKELKEELAKVNNFRKIRLAYALKFRKTNPDSILYRIRNGKAWSSDFEFKGNVTRVLNIVLKSIKSNIDDKKVYLPENIVYSLPTTEKQFTGDLPSGSYVKVPEDMIFGIYWENLKNYRVDLDLALITDKGEKIGWDNKYRSDDKKILFSGDMTDAPHGASELFYVSNLMRQTAIMTVNYYNYSENVVPFSILVANQEPKSFGMNYMVDPNNVVAQANTKIDKRQQILGLLVSDVEGCKFYFAQINIGNSITSTNNENSQRTRNFLIDYYTNTIDLKDILNCEFVDTPEEADIDLSFEKLEKDTFISMFS